MDILENEVIVDAKEKKKLVAILKSKKFEAFLPPHEHYFRNGHPRHGVSVEEAGSVFYQFNRIEMVGKRPAKRGFKYCFYYKMSNKSYYKLMFLLDENPMQLFNAMRTGKNIVKTLFKRHYGF